MPLLQIHCPSCAAEIAAESHFCSVCGHAIVSLSQMPTRGDAAPALPGVSRLISSDSIPVGGFTPGAILADRYRIVGLLGKGGMGEVYRADDLKHKLAGRIVRVEIHIQDVKGDALSLQPINDFAQMPDRARENLTALG